jgi:hypothetical protein
VLLKGDCLLELRWRCLLSTAFLTFAAPLSAQCLQKHLSFFLDAACASTFCLDDDGECAANWGPEGPFHWTGGSLVAEITVA